jgi:cell division protein FtsB
MIVRSSGSGGSHVTSANAGVTGTKAGPARGARFLLLLIVSLGSVHVLFMLGVEGLRLARAEISIARLEREVSALEREAEGLRAVIEHGDDQAYREQLARRQGYMYPDEARIVTSEPR